MSQPRIVTIIQARWGSSRLPGKVLRLLGGEPVLYRVIERVRQSALHGKVGVATSDHPRDDRILAWCEGAGVDCFRGSEADVLARYYHAAVAHDAEIIVRVTSDAPLLDPALL